MRTHAFLGAILVFNFASAVADPNPDAQQVLTLAERQASLFENAKSPFVLESDFTAQINVPENGHMTLKWDSKDRWWRKIVLGGFQQIDVHDGEKRYTVRNLGFTPLRVRELITLTQFAEDPDALIVKKQRQHREGGNELTCVQYERERFKREQHTVCIDPSSHDIVSDDWHEPPDEKRRKLFSDYADIEGLRYPRKLRLQVNGSVAITASITSLAAKEFDETLLTPPQGAIERRDCKGLKQVVPIKTPEPNIDGHGTLMGDTAVSLTILTDGSVGDIQLIGRAFEQMDAETLKTLKGWRFQPAMCGADPVVSDIEVVVSLRQQ